MGDKRLFYAAGGSVLLAYEKSLDHLVVLGDALGKEERFAEALHEFEVFSDTFEYTPVYYQVKTKYMPLYHEFGYVFLNLGRKPTWIFTP